jgi:hypothetical protein
LMPRTASSPWMRRVAPAGVLLRQVQDEGFDAADGGRPVRSFRSGLFGVVTSEQVAVPAQDGVGGDDQVQLLQLWSW